MKDFKEEIERNKKELENYNKIKEKNEKKINFENVPQPFYNGAVHPNDLQPIYHNWNLVNDIHGKKNQTILPQNKLFPRKLISN